MLQLRKSGERGFADHGWLRSRHTFSFADYRDARHMGFRSLRVINEDRIDGGTGFGSHPHRDMEIISYVMEGALEHQDSMGNKTVILPDEVQRMSAGTGIVHSEHNHSADSETHFLQIWILPKGPGGAPGYGQKSFAAELSQKNLVLVVSESGREGSIAIQQDVDLYLSRLQAHDTLEFQLRPARGAWIQLISGRISVNGQEMEGGDGLAVSDENLLSIQALAPSEWMLFDLV